MTENETIGNKGEAPEKNYGFVHNMNLDPAIKSKYVSVITLADRIRKSPDPIFRKSSTALANKMTEDFVSGYDRINALSQLQTDQLITNYKIKKDNKLFDHKKELYGKESELQRKKTAFEIEDDTIKTNYGIKKDNSLLAHQSDVINKKIEMDKRNVNYNRQKESSFWDHKMNMLHKKKDYLNLKRSIDDFVAEDQPMSSPSNQSNYMN